MEYPKEVCSIHLLNVAYTKGASLIYTITICNSFKDSFYQTWLKWKKSIKFVCNSYTKRAIWPEDWWVFVWGSFFWRSEAYKSCISPKCLRWFEGGIMFKTYQYPWKEELCIKIIIVNYMYDKELICTNLRNKNSKNNNLIGHHEDSLDVIISAFSRIFYTK